MRPPRGAARLFAGRRADSQMHRGGGPQSVCVREHVVRIDGTVVATVRTFDGKQRLLLVWQQCRVLADDELFLLGVAHPASFDSRYFGPVARSAVLGVARPLWTRSAP